MHKFLTVGFSFCEKLYQSIIMVKKKSDHTVYQITVMNGDLEKLLHGNHIIKQTGGLLEHEISKNDQQDLLKTSIGKALSKLLKLPLKKRIKLTV